MKDHQDIYITMKMDTMEASSLKQKLRTSYLEWRQARQERNLLNTINQELLDMFLQIIKKHPELSDRERFNKLVMWRNHCDEAAAYEVMRIAEESYASWPQERELTLCDVIHYLAVREFQQQHKDEFWGGDEVAASVRSVVPHKMCPVRLRQPYLSERRKAEREQPM